MFMLCGKIKDVSKAIHGYAERRMVDFAVGWLVLGCFLLVRKLRLLGAHLFLPVCIFFSSRSFKRFLLNLLQLKCIARYVLAICFMPPTEFQWVTFQLPAGSGGIFFCWFYFVLRFIIVSRVSKQLPFLDLFLTSSEFLYKSRLPYEIPVWGLIYIHIYKKYCDLSVFISFSLFLMWSHCTNLIFFTF